jgi:glycosyltransferase involved in cell wall biosynthesis
MADPSLRVLQISTIDMRGGAEKVAWDLFTAYRDRGYGSWLAVGEKLGSDPDVLLIPNQLLRGKWVRFWRQLSFLSDPPGIWKRAAKPLSDLAIALVEPARAFDILRGREDFYFPGSWRLLSLTPEFPHIVHCHNLHGGYFDLRLLPFISQQLPVILTLHDAWLLSGHCAHSFACEKWQSGCGQCPDLTIYPAIRRDATVYNWQRKKEIYARSRLYVATPSQWLMKKVERSMLASAIVEARVIPNGVDLSVFRLSDKQKARAALDIPPNAKVLFATGVMMKQNMWKDYSTLRHSVALAAKRLLGQDVILIVLGENTATERLDPGEIRFVPYQQNPTTVAQYYQAADLYVHAAREDTFPTSVLEAMACGTPVVATAVGGIPEQVEDGRTGFLVSMGDAQGLANRITQLLLDESLRVHIGLQAAGTARRRFGFDQQVDRYLNWYAQLANYTSGVKSTEPAYALSNFS